MRAPSPRPLAAALALSAALVGCGKSLPAEDHGQGAAVTTVAGTGQLAVSGLATQNTARLGGADPVADAAAVALAVHPGLTPTTRPQAVALVNEHNWPAALAAAALASSPLGAPLLYSDGDSLPTVSAQALATMRPTGAPQLGGAQVIELGTTAAPAAYSTRSAAGGPAGDEPAALAAEVERLVELIHGGPPQRVIVVNAGELPALAMPAAGLAAETGAPILLVSATGVPAATRAALRRLSRPTIYAVGPPTAIGHAVLAKLARYGPTRRIDARTGGESGTGAVANAIGVARFSDGSFGWGIDEPGHGLVFANASRPLDAPAAAPLSASGEYGPLLLLESPGPVPAELAEYLSDIKPGYDPGNPEYPAVKGVYNHGWLIGDERAIAATTQAELDALLEIAPTGAATAPGVTSPSPSATSPSSTSTTPSTSPSATSPATPPPATTPATPPTSTSPTTKPPTTKTPPTTTSPATPSTATPTP